MFHVPHQLSSITSDIGKLLPVSYQLSSVWMKQETCQRSLVNYCN